MLFERRQEKVFRLVSDYFRKNKPDPLHDIDHIMRVLYWAELLCRKEKANLDIVIPAALLHDIAIPEYGDPIHARKGAEMCKPLLKKCGYSRDEIDRVSGAILMHSTDDPSPPKTLEARVLFDADKLDAFGLSSLHRWFLYFSDKGYHNRAALFKTLEHIEKWKKRYGNPPFFTKTGKRIGAKRMRDTEKEIARILKDYDIFDEAYNILNEGK